jgi:hypothetical protein
MEIEEMGIEEIAEGLTRLAASEAMEERNEDLAAAGVVLGVKGVMEVETAAMEAGTAKEIAEEGIKDVADGAAELGAAAASSPGE